MKRPTDSLGSRVRGNDGLRRRQFFSACSILITAGSDITAVNFKRREGTALLMSDKPSSESSHIDRNRFGDAVPINVRNADVESFDARRAE